MRRRKCAILCVASFIYVFSFWQAGFYLHETPIPSWVTYTTEWLSEQVVVINDSSFDHPWRMSNLVDRNDFHFVLLEKRCVDDDNNNVFLAVFIHSAPAHFERRRAIRQTWAREASASNEILKVVFLLGLTTSPDLQAAIEEENRIYGGDVVQGNFVDSYRNLTYKHVMGLKWVAHFCRGARYVLKADDDVFLDIVQTVAYLKREFGSTPPTNLLLCFVYPAAVVKRSHRSKWYVSTKEYKQSYFPPYCAGWSVIMSMDVAVRLYFESANITYFWIDDVVVTGILAQKIGIRHSEIGATMPLDTDDRFSLWHASRVNGTPYWFGVPNTDVETIYKLWDITLQYYSIEKR